LETVGNARNTDSLLIDDETGCESDLIII
jgi:hypothetical protein